MARKKDVDLAALADLAGFFMAHAVWCVSTGETLIPLAGHENDEGRALVRFAADLLEEAVASGKEWLEKNPQKAGRAAFIYDGFITIGDVRSDALFVDAVEFGPPRQSFAMAVPYTPRKKGMVFAVHKPKLIRNEGGEKAAEKIGEAFFNGVAQHEKGSVIWSEHRDESF